MAGSYSYEDRPRPGAASSASTLIFLQIGARLFTFLLNQVLVRLVSPSVFGLANIQLELLLSTILFLSREAIRTVLTRSSSLSNLSSHQDETTRPRRGVRNDVHNISLLPIAIGVLLTTVACGVYVIHLSPPEIRTIRTFYLSVGLYAIGALAELSYEPLHIRALGIGQPALRVKAEGVAIGTKTVLTIAALRFLPSLSNSSAFFRLRLADEQASALLAFGIGQASYGLSMLIVFLSWFISTFSISETLDLYIPRKSAAKEETAALWLDKATLSLSWAMSKQCLLKHILTEGDKFALGYFASLEDQGGYALASNYGSLVARILFQPVEETTRIVFSQDLISQDPQASSDQTSTPLSNLDRISNLLSALLRMQVLLGAMFVVFGGPLSVPFLYILAGPRWALTTSAPMILAAYTKYLPVMGINGLVEGFVQSVASENQLARYNKILLLAFFCFCGVMSGSQKLGGEWARTGMVWANVANLVARGAWCWIFVGRWFEFAVKTARVDDNDAESEKMRTEMPKRTWPSTALPTPPVIATMIVIGTTLRIVAPRLMPASDVLLAEGNSGRLGAIRLLLPVLGVGAFGVVICSSAVILFERKRLMVALQSLRGRRGAGKKQQ